MSSLTVRHLQYGSDPQYPRAPRNRQRPKRGRKRLCNAAIHALRMRVERTFAWEDQFNRDSAPLTCH